LRFWEREDFITEGGAMAEENAKSNRVVPSTLIWFAGGTLLWLVLAGAAALVGAITLLGEGADR